MKKGKTVKLNGYRSFKSQFGTIDATNLKSIFLNIQTWVEPKEDVENCFTRLEIIQMTDFHLL